MGFVGLVFFLFLAWLLSESRRDISKKTVFGGLLLQGLLAFLVLGAPKYGVEAPLAFVFKAITEGVDQFLSVTNKSVIFLFGDLGRVDKFGFIFAFQVIPTIIFFSALTQVAYHLGILQRVVESFAFVMRRFLGVGGAESLAASAEIFLGQTESPLMIRPYLAKLTRSELFSVMTGGMATVAGGVLAAFVGLLRGRIPDIAGHLLTASVLAAPAALVISKIMIPEKGLKKEKELQQESLTTDIKPSNVIEAASNGATEGMTLGLNVAAMLIAFIALITLADSAVGLFFGLFGHPEWSAAKIMGLVFAPISFLLGVPWSEALSAGNFLGQKIVLNEFVAYTSLASEAAQLSDKTVVLMSYALCGFANFSSIGIQIGGTGSLIPHRKKEIASLGLKAVLAGNLAGFLTACWASFLI
jgi:CNT family concentrative nucleoside transporter